VAVVAFDVVAAFLARSDAVDYDDLWWVSTLIYVGMGFVAGRELRSVRAGALTGAVVGLVDATVGWTLSYLVEPDLYGYVDDPSVPLIALVVLLVVLLAALAGALGGLLGKALRPARKAS
jgi:hypothetical protein